VPTKTAGSFDPAAQNFDPPMWLKLSSPSSRGGLGIQQEGILAAIMVDALQRIARDKDGTALLQYPVSPGSRSKKALATGNLMRQVAFLEVQAHLLRQVVPFTTTYERMRPCHG
jgi:hypothetical protein